MIPFGDLKRQYFSIKQEINKEINGVLKKGWFILGENVSAFEEDFAQYCGVKYGVGVANGLEALQISLISLNIGAGDEVITAPNSALATSLAISTIGAKPVFVDIDPATYNIDASKIEEKITQKTKAILPVHLFGQPAEMGAINEIAWKHRLRIIEDACQAHGAEYKNRKAGSLGDVGCFSFYPSKNLGAYGDGGMIVTNNKNIAEKAKQLRNYGQAKKNVFLKKGLNSRLDELQAAILRIKLKHLDEWNEKRRFLAGLYSQHLADLPIFIPREQKNCRHIYHLYVVKAKKRNQLQRYLTVQGIETAIHYPKPIYLQKAYRDLDLKKGLCPVAERSSWEILSLPIYPELRKSEVSKIIQAILNFYD